MNPRALLCVLGAVRSGAPALRAGTSVPQLSDVRWPKRIRIRIRAHMGNRKGQSVEHVMIFWMDVFVQNSSRHNGTALQKRNRRCGRQRRWRRGLKRGSRSGSRRSLRLWLQRGLSHNLQQGPRHSLQQGLSRSLQQGLNRSLQQGLNRSLQQGLSHSLRWRLERGTLGLRLGGPSQGCSSL